MRVTVLTAAYNAELFLDRYWSGISAQSYLPLQIIFVDDGSTDDTSRRFEDLAASSDLNGIEVIHLRQENQGPPAAMNLGLKHATGHVVIPLDADDTLLPGAVETFVSAFERDQDVSLVYTDHRVVYKASTLVEDRSPRQVVSKYDSLFFSILAEGMCVPAGSYCYRRDCIALLPNGRFTKEYQAQNLEILLHTAATRKTCYVPVATVELLVREGSRSRANTLERVHRKVAGSHRLQREVAARYRVPWSIRCRLERRLIPLELDYYFLAGNRAKLLSTFAKAIVLRRVSRRSLVQVLACITPFMRRSVMRRYYAGWVFD